MATLDRPQFRPLSLAQFDYQGRSYALLEDPLGVFSTPVLVPLEVFLPICRHFDGQLSLEEIRRRVESQNGKPLYPEALERLVAQLDQAMVLDGPMFASFVDSYRRSSRQPAALAGRSYAGDGALLRDQLRGYFHSPGGSVAVGADADADVRIGVPTANGSVGHGRLRGVLSLHIAAVNPARWFATAAAVSNRFRVCGLATTYTMLHAIGPARGRLLKYELTLDERRTCGVSFASMVFRTPSEPGQPEAGTDR
ncbi:MAG: hypothetical protein JO161_05395 [Planctomycetaceae bacterium]|nr:hypothetical protein [Planctomycetaceae bacterium]